jgi:Putative Flp pilus-assembly TadE/G-like
MARTKRRGQVLLIYGVASTAVIGFAGLAVDGGYIFMQRRLAQNGADAGALVGARDVVNGSYSSIDSDVTTYGRGNAGSTATITWGYVDNSGATVTQSSATGVSVLATKAFPTFFIRVLGIPSFTVSARGIARVQTLAGASDVPFMVCAEALRYANPPTPYPGGIMDYTTNPPSILESAVGTSLWIHGSQLGQNGGDCGWTGGNVKFKGNALRGSDIGCASMPCYYPWDQGNTSGTTDVRVAGMQGCSGPVDSYAAGCVALLPVIPKMNATGDTCPRPLPTSNGGDNACVVAWAAFQLYPGGPPNAPPGCSSSNCHKATLLGNVLVTQGVGVDWTPGASGTLVVRLLG